MTIQEGPFKTSLGANLDKCIKQELKTYTLEDGNVVIETATRNFFADDYVDDVRKEILTLNR